MMGIEEIALQQWYLKKKKHSRDEHHLGETTGKVISFNEDEHHEDRKDCFAAMVSDRFRKLLDSDGDPIADNFRPIQVWAHANFILL